MPKLRKRFLPVYAAYMAANLKKGRAKSEIAFEMEQRTWLKPKSDF